MLDRRRRDELEGVLSLGRLADRMVFVLGRVLRSDAPQPDDSETLAQARRLFELMSEEKVIVLDRSDDRMFSDESYLDALHVVELRAKGAEAEDCARRYAELLQKAATPGEIDDDERMGLAALRDLFADVGETTLSRANELCRPWQESPWQIMQPATSHF